MIQEIYKFVPEFGTYNKIVLPLSRKNLKLKYTIMKSAKLLLTLSVIFIGFANHAQDKEVNVFLGTTQYQGDLSKDLIPLEMPPNQALVLLAGIISTLVLQYFCRTISGLDFR